MNNPTVTASLSAGRRQQMIIGAVLAAQVAAVLALLPGRQEPPVAPAPPPVATPTTATPLAARPVEARKSGGKKAAKRDTADVRRPAARTGKTAAAATAAATTTVAPRPRSAPAARAEGADAPPLAETTPPLAEATHADGMDVVEGTWVGVRSCADSPDLHIALKIAAGKAWVYSHSGPAAAPLSPGCLSATWSYNAGRTHLQVLPQAWLWRTAQTSALRLEGFVSGRRIEGEIADVSGCRAFTLHKVAANAFPIECR